MNLFSCLPAWGPSCLTAPWGREILASSLITVCLDGIAVMCFSLFANSLRLVHWWILSGIHDPSLFKEDPCPEDLSGGLSILTYGPQTIIKLCEFLLPVLGLILELQLIKLLFSFVIWLFRIFLFHDNWVKNISWSSLYPDQKLELESNNVHFFYRLDSFIAFSRLFSF